MVRIPTTAIRLGLFLKRSWGRQFGVLEIKVSRRFFQTGKLLNRRSIFRLGDNYNKGGYNFVRRCC